jgi:integrase
MHGHPGQVVASSRRPAKSRGSSGSTARLRARNWATSIERFATEEVEPAGVGEAWKRRLLYEVARTPGLLRRVGADPLPLPAQVRAEHILRMKQRLTWSPAAFSLHFAALRRFLRWSGNSVADDRPVWTVPSGYLSRRRWLDSEQFVRLYRAARGRERVLVALEGFNGLRRVEVLRLRTKDIDFEHQRLRVLGKGRHGGKWRMLPMFSETARVLRSVRGNGDGSGAILPLSRSGADLVLRRAAERAGFAGIGLVVSHHDLRRTFGRLAHKAGMDLVQLKNLYGHSSLDQTVHYIGLDEDEMRAGLDRLASMITPMLRSK